MPGTSAEPPNANPARVHPAPQPKRTQQVPGTFFHTTLVPGTSAEPPNANPARAHPAPQPKPPSKCLAPSSQPPRCQALPPSRRTQTRPVPTQTLNQNHPASAWHLLPHHPGARHFRRAAGGKTGPCPPSPSTKTTQQVPGTFFPTTPVPGTSAEPPNAKPARAASPPLRRLRTTLPTEDLSPDETTPGLKPVH